MSTSDDDLEDQQRAADAEVERIENDLAHAEEALEELGRETPTTPDEIAVWESGVRMTEADLEGLRNDLREAEEAALRITIRLQEAWGQEEEHEEDASDDGWPIDPEGPDGR